MIVYEETLPIKCYVDAQKLLGETRDLRTDSISRISEWLEENPKINGHNDPTTILFFLRGCKFNLDKTKKKIKWQVFVVNCQ